MIRLVSQLPGNDLTGATMTPISSVASSSATYSSAQLQQLGLATHHPALGASENGDPCSGRDLSLEPDDRGNDVRLVHLDHEPPLAPLNTLDLLDDLRRLLLLGRALEKLSQNRNLARDRDLGVVKRDVQSRGGVDDRA